MSNSAHITYVVHIMCENAHYGIPVHDITTFSLPMVWYVWDLHAHCT